MALAYQSDADSQKAVRSACRTAVEIWSSIDEKLEAIEFLGGLDDPSVLESLEEAFTLVGLSRPNNPKGRIRGSLAAGEVSGAAARALGGFRDGLGLRILSRYLFDDVVLRPLRESAASGLGGLTSAAAFSLMTRGMEIEDKDVRYRILLAARESLDRVGNWNADHIQEFLDAAISLAFRQGGDPRSEAGLEAELLAMIVARYGTSRSEAVLSEVVCRGPDLYSCEAALRILVRRNGQDLGKTLLRAFSRADRPARFYLMLAEEMIMLAVPGVQEAAEDALQPRGLGGRLKAFLSRRERQRRAAHVEAAHLVMLRLNDHHRMA